jgi:hypothetical protein
VRKTRVIGSHLLMVAVDPRNRPQRLAHRVAPHGSGGNRGRRRFTS